MSNASDKGASRVMRSHHAPVIAAALAAVLAFGCSALHAEDAKPGHRNSKLVHSSGAARAQSATALTAGSNLNVPATDFTNVEPVIDDPKEARNHPKRKPSYFDVAPH